MLSSEISASRAVALQSAQTQQAASQVGIKTALKKDQAIVGMLQRAQQDLQAITPTRGNSVNLNV